MDRDKLKELLNSNEIMEFNDLLGKKVYTLSLKEIGVLCNNLYKIINKSK
jgi:sporulation protein YlmC with PRC-barrel domain